MKKLIIFLVILIPFVSALNIGMTPDRILLETQQNKEICADFSLIGDKSLVFLGEVRWSEKPGTNINNYFLLGKEVGVQEKYPERVESGRYQIC